MNFSNVLNKYIEQIGCTANDISNKSGISPSTISRFRTNQRTPAKHSDTTLNLSKALCAIALEKNIKLSQEIVYNELNNTLADDYDYDDLSVHFDRIIDVHQINMADLSKSMNFDPSFLSRVRSGQRKPANVESFISTLCNYVVSKYSSPDSLAISADLLDCDIKDLQGSDYLIRLKEWFGSTISEKKPQNTKQIETILKKIDEFNLDEYNKSNNLEDLKISSAPFSFLKKKDYYGAERMREGILDFFKATISSKSTEPVFLCSDIPIDNPLEETEFKKKWISEIAICLNKGLKINMIHNLDRPWNEIMFGLETWLPLYMTGQITPYYFPSYAPSIYKNLTYVSGSSALSGECVKGNLDNGKCYLASSKEELEYYKKFAADLLGQAKPVMEIFDKSSTALFSKRVEEYFDKKTVDIKNIIPTPPLYTMSKDLFNDILDFNHIPISNRDKYYEGFEHIKNNFNNRIKDHIVLDQISELYNEDFADQKIAFKLPYLTDVDPLYYTFEHYEKHINQTLFLASSDSNYTAEEIPPTFKNLSICIVKGKCAFISKHDSPTINFVVHHPKLVEALENYTIADIEE